MTTKTVNLYVDLPSGWQDVTSEWMSLYASEKVNGEVPIGWKRVRIICELPCFGGSAESGCTVTAVTKPASGYIQESEVTE
jgi:hypothetical protein